MAERLPESTIEAPPTLPATAPETTTATTTTPAPAPAPAPATETTATTPTPPEPAPTYAPASAPTFTLPPPPTSTATTTPQVAAPRTDPADLPITDGAPPAADELPAYSRRDPGHGNNGPINRQFPPSFGVYREATWSQRHYAIGEHQSHSLYAVTLHTGWSGEPDIVLHNGPSESSPPLATVEHVSLSRTAIITLPPLPGSRTTTVGGGAEEKLEAKGLFGYGTLTFGIETGPGLRRETFEWRHSKAAEVGSLGGRSHGWKLVRMATDAPGGMTVDGAKFVGGGPTTSDGREVVAVWAWTGIESLMKQIRFQFLGSGANGALGERWAVMAVITALRIWDNERNKQGGAAASNPSSATASASASA